MAELSKEQKEEINSKISNGIILKREEVGGKVRYSYNIYFDCDPSKEISLKSIEYAKEQLENIIISKKVEARIDAMKAVQLDQ